MNTKNSLDHITIRTDLGSGDLGYITYLHGILYKQEYGYGISFEAYVAKGLAEFFQQYDPSRNRVWVCEDDGRIIGSLILMDRGKAAQLRYFLIHPKDRGIGLGKKLLKQYMDFLHHCGYQSSYLWTTHELETAAYLYQSVGFVLAEEKESTAFGKQLFERKYELTVAIPKN